MMGNATHKKRLDRLRSRPAQNKPARNIHEDIEALTELAAEGIVSAETLEKIHAGKHEKGFDPYDCCTVEELRRMLALWEQNQ